MIVQLKMRANCVRACMLQWICVSVFVEICLKAIRNTFSNYVDPIRGDKGMGRAGCGEQTFLVDVTCNR